MPKPRLLDSIPLSRSPLDTVAARCLSSNWFLQEADEKESRGSQSQAWTSPGVTPPTRRQEEEDEGEPGADPWESPEGTQPGLERGGHWS